MEILNQIKVICDGIEYSRNIPEEAKKIAKENNIVVIVGGSDDLMYCYGADCYLTQKREHGYGWDGDNLEGISDKQLEKEAEQLGLMIWWCGEPSAGHGAIARFFPVHTENVFVEQSYDLASKLSVNVNGTVKTQRFEDYHIINKFDGIAMNPPFGSGGKLAMEHINKALRHLSFGQNTRLIAIVPNGPSMQKRLDLYSELRRQHEPMITTEVILPSFVFERAGTSVYCRVVVFEKADSYTGLTTIDLTHTKDINEFFDEIEHLEI